MKVGSIAIDAADLADLLKARTAPKRVRLPNCTHITMARVHYGMHYPCPVCGRVPPLGFLYECVQDIDIAFSHRSAEVNDGAPAESTKSDLRRELEDIGVSESIIKTAEQGGYTEEQIEKVKAMKQAVNHSIADAVQAQQINNAVAKLSHFEQGTSNNDGALNSTPVKEVVSLNMFHMRSQQCADTPSLRKNAYS